VNPAGQEMLRRAALRLHRLQRYDLWNTHLGQTNLASRNKCVMVLRSAQHRVRSSTLGVNCIVFVSLLSNITAQYLQCFRHRLSSSLHSQVLAGGVCGTCPPNGICEGPKVRLVRPGAFTVTWSYPEVLIALRGRCVKSDCAKTTLTPTDNSSFICAEYLCGFLALVSIPYRIC
jgi:hypothetical protein